MHKPARMDIYAGHLRGQRVCEVTRTIGNVQVHQSGKLKEKGCHQINPTRCRYLTHKQGLTVREGTEWETQISVWESR